MAETGAVEVALVERAARERWSPQELRLAVVVAAPLLTEAEVARVVEAIVAAASVRERARG